MRVGKIGKQRRVELDGSFDGGLEGNAASNQPWAPCRLDLTRRDAYGTHLWLSPLGLITCLSHVRKSFGALPTEAFSE